MFAPIVVLVQTFVQLRQFTLNKRSTIKRKQKPAKAGFLRFNKAAYKIPYN
jgi:hypothetical protein